MNWFLFLFASATWGGSFIAIRFMLEGFPPFAAAGVRTALASLLMAGLALQQRRKFPRGRTTFARMAALGMVNFGIPWACLFWGEQYVQPAVASILNSTTPLFVFLLSYWLLSDERPTWGRFAGVVLGFAGIILVFGPSVRGFSADPKGLQGMTAIALMSIGYATGAILMKRIGKAIDIRWNISFQCAAASLFLLSMSAGFEPAGWVRTAWGNPKAVTSLFYLAVVSTTVGWIIYFHLIRTWGVLKASATTYLMPFVALFLDWLWLGRVPSTAELLGGALIVGSVGLIHLARPRLVEA